MFVGYARVSLPEQHLALQTDALQRAGCERLYTDTVSGGQAERPGLRTALEVLALYQQLCHQGQSSQALT